MSRALVTSSVAQFDFLTAWTAVSLALPFLGSQAARSLPKKVKNTRRGRLFGKFKRNVKFVWAFGREEVLRSLPCYELSLRTSAETLSRALFSFLSFSLFSACIAV